MFRWNKDYILHKIFLIGIIIKFIDGVFEFIGGILLNFVKVNYVVNILKNIYKQELLQDPADLIANYIMNMTQYISSSTISFASIYLIVHGGIKIALVLSLFLKRKWAYPVAAVVLILFDIYQVIRIINYHSLILLFLTITDIIIIILLRFEYKRKTS